MARFDVDVSHMKPWLADRVVSDCFIDERRRAAFLHRHFCAPGLLGGLDLADGTECITIQPEDHAAFFLSHTLGPGRIGVAPRVKITTVDGVDEERQSFFRTTTRHVGSEGKCSFVAITFQNENSLQPSPLIMKASRGLSGRGINHAIERSFRIGRWTLWGFLQHPLPLEQVQSIAWMCREAIQLSGVQPDQFHIPLLENDVEPIYIPYHFFCADYFGMLHSLDEDDDLVAMNPNSIPPLDVSPHAPQMDCAAKPLQAASVGPSKHPWNDVLEAWYEGYGERRVRAGELVSLIGASKLVPPEAPATWHESSQAAAIWLGKRLQSLVGATINAHQIEATRSGNSTVFCLRRQQTPATS